MAKIPTTISIERSATIGTRVSRVTPRDRERELFAITLHTLRKDGFTYLRSQGDWGEFLSKPFDPDVRRERVRELLSETSAETPPKHGA